MTSTGSTSDKTGRNRGPADTSERKHDDVNDAQPYSNRGTEDESTEPRGYEEESEGDRGDLSGRNLDQLEQARTRPEDRK
jgi:hypothetical protein